MIVRGRRREGGGGGEGEAVCRRNREIEWRRGGRRREGEREGGW